MMTSEWSNIANGNLQAAQHLAGDYARSCVSRAYYAAFSAVSFVLREHAPFRWGRETPPHQDVPELIGRHLGSTFVPDTLRELKTRLRRLRSDRIIADYRSRWTVDTESALRARRDAFFVCRALGVHP
jgi:uncharacterized protein (UPF0332 family)